MRTIARIVVFLLVILIASGCNLPTPGQTPTPLPEENVLPAVSVGPLPPALVEADPLPGSRIPAASDLRFFFNQPMDRASVEAAISASPALNGSFTWEDDHQLVFQPAQPWAPNTFMEVTIAASARSQDGQTMPEPVILQYQTANYLRLVQALPEDQTFEINPESAIVASFNQPVVPLGADSAGLPAGFTLSPGAAGRGEWLNTSTYIFYPQPALTGGLEYTVTLNPDLSSTAETPLESAVSWRFVTLTPGFVSYSPAMDALHIQLDESVTVTFNQAMDPDSVEAGFSLRDQDQNPVAGEFSWSDDLTTLTFTPNRLYQRGMRYTFSIPAGVLSLGGTPLPEGMERSFYAAMDFFVLETNPPDGGQKQYYSPIEITFNAPIGSQQPEDFIAVSPEVRFDVNVFENQISIYGDFQAEQTYTITVGGGLTDLWGGQLGDNYSFSFTGAPLTESFQVASWLTNGVFFVNPDEPLISAQVVNVDQVNVQTGQVSFEEFLFNQHEADYEQQQQFQPANLNAHQQALDIASNRNQVIGVELNGGSLLGPGLYWVGMQPVPAQQFASTQPVYAVVSYVQMVFKISPTNALVWAIDTRTGASVQNIPVRIFNADGVQLAAGSTDGTGFFMAELEEIAVSNNTYYALLAEPGDQFYSLARSDWNQGVSGWDFGYETYFRPPHTDYYIYTDRPIYRPGQLVNFRVIVREAFNGRYDLPVQDQIELNVRDAVGDQVVTLVLPLNEFGAASGSFTLAENALPGFYDLFTEGERASGAVSFQVAEYRKPEVELTLGFNQQDYLAGEQMSGDVSARYYFDAPAAGSEIGWNVYARETTFSLPGYKVGPTDMVYYGFPDFGGILGTNLAGGMGTTGEDGTFSVNFSSEAADRTQIYTLETVVQDESGFPVSNRTTTTVHPERIYIGLKADSWIGQVDSEIMFEIKVVDWNRQSAGVQNLEVAFGEVTWEQVRTDRFGFPSFEKQFNVLSQGAFQTSAEGLARIPFTPAEPGVYQFEARSGNAVSQLLLWVGGPGTAVWPSQDGKQIELQVEKESYQPGEVAAVFIPNPFPQEALALVTLERGEILQSQIIKISGAGMNFPVTLESDSAPNVYLTVTLLGTEENGQLGFRYGLANLPVSTDALLLNVEVLGQPERTAPGEPVELSIRVTDQDGEPVEGEFSLAVVDQAVLALADRFESPIEEAYYGQQQLGVKTGISLVADAELFFELPGGLGGGGGDMAPQTVRSDFQDTAYWNATVVTGPDGTASVEITLPDNLTTWQILARGLTKDTLVGEGLSEVITTKPLLIRPVTPRFAVAGDQLELAAVVHNNTAQSFEAAVTLSASGFVLADQNAAQQTISLPAGGQVRVSWPGRVGSADAIEAVFAVEGGGLSDASTPLVGDIPIVGYLAPQAFLTAGVLDQGGERQELVSLPRSFVPAGGSLRLEMAPSLAGVALDGLDVIESYQHESTEYLVSSFLPNIEMMLAIQQFGLDDTALRTRLDANLRVTLIKLQNSQQFDGGWGWYPRAVMESSPTISAYVLLGLVRSQQAGYEVNQFVIDNVRNYLTDVLYTQPPSVDRPWLYDRSVLIHYALMQAGYPLYTEAERLAENRESMSAWGQALFGVLMAEGGRTDLANTIFSDLQSTTVRSATGVHWAGQGGRWETLSSDVVNNAIVIYALAQRDPASPLVADAVRYLMSLRDRHGGWRSSYGTAWALMALTEVMRGTGELGGEFAYAATLNGNPFATGEAGGTQQFNQVVAETSLQSLLPDLPNALVIQRDPGPGRLYYRAELNVMQPVAEVQGLNRGIGVSRVYYPADQDCSDGDCQPVAAARIGDLLTVRVTLNLPDPMHYLQVEDYIPAGTEVLNRSLKTSQLGVGQETQNYQPDEPYLNGWGWWYFGSSQVYDDHVAWTAEYLPAGTYELTYTLVVVQPGVFQARPARAWQIYFPEVQGISAGSVLEVQP